MPSHHISTLPNEITESIMEYLPLKDRKSASLVCRLWNQEAFSRRLQSTVQLKIRSNVDSRSLEVLQNSIRSYRNLCVGIRNHSEFDSPQQFQAIKAALDSVASGVERLTKWSYSTLTQLKELITVMPNLKHLTVLVHPVRGTHNVKLPSLKKLSSLEIVINPRPIAGNGKKVFPKLQVQQLRALKITTFIFDNTELNGLFHQVLPLRELRLDCYISRKMLEGICRNCPLLIILGILRAHHLETGSFQCFEKLTDLQVSLLV